MLADVNGDSQLDLPTANNDSTTVSVRLGDGAGQFSVGANTLVSGDVGGDGVADFAILLTGGRTLQVVDFIL